MTLSKLKDDIVGFLNISEFTDTFPISINLLRQVRKCRFYNHIPSFYKKAFL